MTLASSSPIVNSIVFNLIREIHFEEFKFSKKETIDTVLVPHVSEAVLLRKGFTESSYQQPVIQPMQIPPFLPAKTSAQTSRDMPQIKKEIPQSAAPRGFQESIVEKDRPAQSVSSPTPLPTISPNVFPPLRPPVPRLPPIIPINLFQNPPTYGKLNMVLRDPYVLYIECPGPGQRLVVTKNGRRQQTNIVLVKEEIQMLLNNISAKTKIPLITGVFRVSWDNLVINAIVSDNLEPRFIIKKEL